MPRKPSPFSNQASELSFILGRKLTHKEWGQIGSLVKKWGKDKVDAALSALKKCETPDKSKFAIQYLFTVCRNEAIEKKEINPKRNLRDLLSQDRSIDD